MHYLTVTLAYVYFHLGCYWKCYCCFSYAYFQKESGLSFIPLGTTNDLAKTLDMPIKDISITKNLLQSKAKVVDIGRWNEKFEKRGISKEI